MEGLWNEVREPFLAASFVKSGQQREFGNLVFKTFSFAKAFVCVTAKYSSTNQSEFSCNALSSLLQLQRLCGFILI